jgi:hypothetical protein
MNANMPRNDEIYIRLAPSPPDLSQELQSSESRKTVQELMRSYDAFIYTNLTLPGLSPRDPSQPIEKDSLTMLPLVAIEHVVVKWSRYQDYLATFVEGTKDPIKMRYKLFEILSSGLQALFSGQKLADDPVRVWWSCETPELEDLPWELIAYGSRSGSFNFSFVRGRPPSTPTPQVPLSGPLRLALIYQPSVTPAWLIGALTPLPGIEVIHLTGSPRQALLNAARQGFELVHLVADGLVSLAYEGILYLFGEDSPELSVSELSALLNGSRVSVLSLTEPQISTPDVVQIGHYEVPSAYRAYAYLGRSTLPLPNIIAPLGPHEFGQMNLFWRNFYTELNQSLRIEAAIAFTQASVPPIAMTLFLRQSQQHTFHRLAPTQQIPSVDPNQVNADLQQSREMVSQFNSLQERYGDLPESVKKFLDNESTRQAKLVAALTPWLETGAAKL